MKNRIYLIICILTAVLILSTAAACNLGGALNEKISAEGLFDEIDVSIKDNNGSIDENSQNDSGSKESGNSASSSTTSSQGSASSSTTSSQGSASSSTTSSQGNNSNKSNESNKSSNSVNNSPVIKSIVASSDTFLPGMTYTFISDVTDPDNDTITYDWHIDSGYVDTPESPTVNWTVPNSDGLFKIILTVSDGWGGYDSMTMELFVGKAAANTSPVIDNIAIYPSGGIYTDNTYEIWCYITDTIGIADVAFSINGGFLHSHDANVIKWDTPGVPGTYTVNVTVTNYAGNKVSDSKNFVVEQAKAEITDLIVQIDYIEAGASYYLTAVIIDPKDDISSYEWSCSGGGIHSNNGYNAVWDTPSNPGTYSLTLKAFTFSGNTLSRTESFEVKLPQ